MSDHIIIGFDSEYVLQPATKTNRILSYQFSVKTSKGTHNGIVYTAGPERKHRWKLADLIGHAIQEARTAKVIDRKWPKKVFAVAHFTRADIGAFRDFKQLKTEFDALRGSYNTINRPYKCHFNDSGRNKRKLDIVLRDTMTIAPGGTALADLGELHGLEKIDLPRGTIEQMDVLLRDDKDLFEKYAIRDAEIAALHAWEMAEFCKKEGLGDEPPLTLGTLATQYVTNLWKASKIDKHEVLGTETVKERFWNGKQYITRKKDVPTKLVSEYITLATESFHGGRNEAYMFGLTEFDDWTDLDLSGAYSTAMAAIRMPSWDKIKPSKKVKDYTCDVLGVARIKFKFPDTVRHPCIPVRTDHGLIFPLEGESYCGSPEIELAVNLGAKVTIENGVIVPWKSKTRPFELFSTAIRKNRNAHPKGSVYERAWKEIGNSVYGKLAQGLREKRVYDSRAGQSARLPESPITQAFLATYITSIIRAVLGELLESTPANKQVVSVTTDGFITNLTRKEIDVSGPLCRFFSQQAKRLTGDPQILEVKHYVPQVLCFKTRGQLTVGSLIELPVLQARAGTQVPSGITEDAFDRWKNAPEWSVPDEIKEEAENDWMLDLFTHRTKDTTVPQWSLTSMRKMDQDDADLVREDRDVHLNMEYDWKRELVQPEMRAAGQVVRNVRLHQVTCTSVPLKDIEAFKEIRGRFDQWRRKDPGCLKTVADWSSWNDYRVSGHLKDQGAGSGRGTLVEQAKREFLREYTNKENGYPGGKYKDVAAWLTKEGYPTTENDVKNAKRAKKSGLEWRMLSDGDAKGFADLIINTTW
jgi:hypothetical protein